MVRLKHLSLTNFRNFGRLDLPIPDGIILVQGANAQGKTNLLESIYYLATTRSPYTNQDSQLINWDAGYEGAQVIVGRLVAHLETAEGMRHLELRLIREQKGTHISFRREALVDRRKVRLLDLLGNLPVVLFVPTDLDLITGSPLNRRRYLDITLCQRNRHYCHTLSQYNKILEQRNALLRQIADGHMRAYHDMLELYTNQLVEAAGQIFLSRATLLNTLARDVQRIHYEQLTDGNESLRLLYQPRLSAKEGDKTDAASWLQAHLDNPSAIAQQMKTALETILQDDIRRGTTSIGPHRDDWLFQINGRHVRHYGSRGQQRTAVLALKLAEIIGIKAETKQYPILLLDDVMAELDKTRRTHLLTVLQEVPQTMLTSADTTIFPNHFLSSVHHLVVESGRIETTNEAHLTHDFS